MIPNLSSAVGPWGSPISLIKFTQTIVNYQTVNAETTFVFRGVVQPLSANQLMIKPISERSWEWFQIHTKTRLTVSTNDRIEYNGQRYKIMAQNNYEPYGYYEYHVVKDYV